MIIPMHYRQGDKGFLELDTVDAFLSLFPAEQVRWYPVSPPGIDGGYACSGSGTGHAVTISYQYKKVWDGIVPDLFAVIC